MEIKELFESMFLKSPEVFYICGNPYRAFVISKFTLDEYYSLDVLDVTDKRYMCIKVGDFDELMNIVNLLTYSSDKMYYERLAE